MKRRNVYLATTALMALLAFGIAGCSNTDGVSNSSIQSEPSENESSHQQVAASTSSSIQDQINENLPITLQDLEDWQLSIFETTSVLFVDEVLSNKMLVGELDIKQADIIEAQMIDGLLPSNALQLFAEWKDEVGFYNQFTSTNYESQSTERESQSGQQSQQSSQGTQGQGQGTSQSQQSQQSQNTSKPSAVTESQGGKPQPSDQQQQQQAQGSGSGSVYGEGLTQEIIDEGMEGLPERTGSFDNDTFHADEDFTPID